MNGAMEATNKNVNMILMKMIDVDIIFFPTSIQASKQMPKSIIKKKGANYKSQSQKKGNK